MSRHYVRIWDGADVGADAAASAVYAGEPNAMTPDRYRIGIADIRRPDGKTTDRVAWELSTGTGLRPGTLLAGFTVRRWEPEAGTVGAWVLDGRSRALTVPGWDDVDGVYYGSEAWHAWRRDARWVSDCYLARLDEFCRHCGAELADGAGWHGRLCNDAEDVLGMVGALIGGPHDVG